MFEIKKLPSMLLIRQHENSTSSQSSGALPKPEPKEKDSLFIILNNKGWYAFTGSADLESLKSFWWIYCRYYLNQR